jgi:hypothetical protein
MYEWIVRPFLHLTLTAALPGCHIALFGSSGIVELPFARDELTSQSESCSDSCIEFQQVGTE